MFQVFDGEQGWRIDEKSQIGFLYADDVCLMEGNDQHMQTILIIWYAN